ncbi:MAG TPA: SDR family oxidoreductase, partial [Polyangiales bacterium]|nr:SDR family oxidoreductase [Polyangiales bacterium]
LADSLEERELPWSPELQRRISVLVGDIAAPQLGLTDPQWHALAHDVDCIVNVAAAVDFMRGYPSLRKSNVLGPLTLATLAGTGPVKSLHQVSTISIFDELGIRSVAEDDPPAHVDRLFAGYETTKWAAEAVLRRARERGLPMSVYRPGGIVGHTVTGVYNPQDLSSGFMAAWQALRALPAFRHMHAAPVDWVSRIISELVLDPNSWGYNYHVTGEPISMQRMTRDMALSGMNVRVVGFEAWLQMFHERMQRDSIPSLAFLDRALQNPGTLHLVRATLNAPAARADRTEAYIRRHKLPTGRYDPRTAIATTERLVRDGRASLPGRNDAPYLCFRETLRGELAAVSGEPLTCEIDLDVSMASFYQLLRERRVDLHGEVRCHALHPEPLALESGDCWFRPDAGIPERHGLEHPLMRYHFVARARDGRRFVFEGKKFTRPGRDQWLQGRTLQLAVSVEGGEPAWRGELIVPADSFVPDQIDGIAVDGSSQQQRGLAKLIWLVWFNAQFTLAFSEPVLRALVQLVDVSRGTTLHEGAR